MSNPISIEIEVAAGAGGSVSLRCFAPDAEAAEALPGSIWAVLLPGGTERWNYWDAHPPGSTGTWSFAEFLVARGIGVVTWDTFGLGDSHYRGHGSELNFELLVEAHAQVVATLRDKLLTGCLLLELAAMRPIIAGIGHSGGGALAVGLQGDHACFDLLTVLGMPAGAFGGPADDSEPQDIREMTATDSDGLLHLPMTASGRAVQFLADVPDAVVAWFESQMVPLLPGQLSNMLPGEVASRAAQVTVPTFLGFGEVDFALEPLMERDYYGRCSDLTIWIQPGSGHGHHLSLRRTQISDAIFSWIWGRTRQLTKSNREASL